MKYIDRKGNITIEENSQDKLLRHLYTDWGGRFCLKILIRPFVSRLAGIILKSRISAGIVPGFAVRNGIDMSEYEEKKYCSYNDFFTRKIKPGVRPVAKGDHILVSPCDGKLSVHRIGADSRFFIKNTEYTVEQLLRSKSLAKKYEDGYAVVIRLTVDNYHHYCYPAEGVQSSTVSLAGCFHTVNPTAGEHYPIYKENAREYALLQTAGFGTILMMEVGAMMVGKIRNRYKTPHKVEKGEEKGYFEFGGSTLILLLQHGKVRLDFDLLENTENGYETIVRMGERIGEQKLPKRTGKDSVSLK